MPIASQVARQGQAFAHSHLQIDGRSCYWRKLLHGWAKRLACAFATAPLAPYLPLDGPSPCQLLSRTPQRAQPDSSRSWKVPDC